MKCAHSIFLIVFLFVAEACSGPSRNEENSADRYAMDTLLIDSGSSIIDLEENLAFSGVSTHGKILFHFDPKALKLQVIDLEAAKIGKEIVFEKEGPNGIGDWHLGFQVLNDSTFVLMGDNTFLLIDGDGNLKQKIRLDHLFYSQEDLIGRWSRSGFLLKDGKIFTCIDSWGGPSINLMVYDPLNDTYEIKEILGADNMLSSAYVTYIKKSSFHHYYGFSLMDFSGDLLIHHRTYPEVAVYEVE